MAASAEGSLSPRPRWLDRLHRVHPDDRRERQFVSSVGFAVAYGAARAITHAMRARRKPSRTLSPRTLSRHLPGRRQRHHHHLVLGILLLLTDGYAWLLQFGTGIGHSSRWGSWLTALAYGVGSALTLDEFAPWLNLEDVYWAREGRESVDAVVVFGALLSVGVWGGPIFRGLAREATRAFRR